MDQRTLVLASASPRRADLLRQIGLEFSVVPADIEEIPRGEESPSAYVTRLAAEKAGAVFERLVKPGDDMVVLGADTIVVLEDEILEKPLNAQHAEEMLARLSGCVHQVLTGVHVVANGDHAADVVTTHVTLANVPASARTAYINTGEPMDKAGAYGIQGMFGVFAERIDGSYSNVVGLPLNETAALLWRFGIGRLPMTEKEHV